ncbi:hypothetical protein QBC45DRAFT_340346, partial [Copromyces sp. CBS 386.78]
VILFPYFDFINKFSIFYNSYYTLIGFYFTPAGLLAKERIQFSSIFPLLLSLYRSKLEDITKALKTIT